MDLEIFERGQATEQWCMGRNCRSAGARGTTVVIDNESEAIYNFCPDCAEPWGRDQGIGPNVYDALNQPYPPELEERLRAIKAAEEMQRREADEAARQKKITSRFAPAPQPSRQQPPKKRFNRQLVPGVLAQP